MDQASSFRNAFLLEDEKKLCDLLISPDITGYSAASFDATDSLIIRGEKAALAVEDKIKALAKSLEKYKLSKARKINTASLYSIFINEVKIEGLENVSEKLVRSKLNIESATWVDLKNIEKGVDRVYGSQFFDKVNYKIIQNGDKNTLIIRVYEKPFSVVKVGANYNNYFNASLLLNGTFRNILGEGSKLLLSGKLSEAPEASLDYSIFTKYKPSIGFRTLLNYFTLEEKLFFPDDSLNLSMRHHRFSGKLAAVSSLSNSVYFAAGAEYKYDYFNVIELEQSNYNGNFSFFKLFGEIYVDTYDRTVFPTSGFDIKLKADYLLFPLFNDNYQFDSNYWRFSLQLKRYIPVGKKLNFSYAFNSSLVLSDNVYIGDYYRLGGETEYQSYVFPLSGFRFMEFSTLNLISGRLAFRYEFLKNKYISINADGAFTGNKIDELVIADKFLLGGAIGVGANTIIGPLEFKISKNNINNRWEFWLQLGYRF
ncbi:MAG: BamA/TamA family outer membrane protein [Bacteroidales bacterium]|nr:BamA/TamA family outer membrane protein [Bacteroidales bacterium]